MTDPLSINLTEMFLHYDWLLDGALTMVGETHDGHTILAVQRATDGLEFTFDDGTTHTYTT